ncbi:hypothetical protein N7540_006735 [Penicillium herquei]|nr:hypothetical protein N7540_006735 [Penicillium herquei]
MALDHETPDKLEARLKDIDGRSSQVQCGPLEPCSQTDPCSSSLEWQSSGKPTLERGTYSIGVPQSVGIPDNPTRTSQSEKDKTETLTVLAPRFNLPNLDILSIYPPASSTAPLTILPSIVFAHPTLPWERATKYTTSPGYDQGIVPWLALIIFEKDELMSKPESLTSISDDPETGSFELRLADLISCPDISLPILKIPEAMTADETAVAVDVIFLSPSKFMPLLYNSYQDDGSLKLPDSSTPAASDVSRYQYFAHTRKAAPDRDGVDSKNFSVIFSHRTANASKKAARTVAVHLVSIEGWDLMKLPADCSKSAVALISLHSWTYTVNPAASPQYLDPLQSLAGSTPAGEHLKIPNSLQMSDNRMLRNPSATIAKFDSAVGPSPENLTAFKAKLACGYSIHKHRLPTGESTIALYRGPLTPVPVPHDIFATLGKTGEFHRRH